MDKRRAPRNRSLLQGKVVYNDGLASMDCLVRNQSPGGMRLAISQTVLLPDEFDLHIPKKHEIHRVRMKWRSADEVGVAYVRAFINKVALVSVAGASAARLDEIDVEIARLEGALTALQQKRNRMRAALGECDHEEPALVTSPADQPTLTTAAADAFDETTGEPLGRAETRFQRCHGMSLVLCAARRRTCVLASSAAQWSK
jgi:hypothetical protein